MNDAQERWAALPELPAAHEKKITARRDAAIGALTDSTNSTRQAAAIAANAEPRREMLLELELVLGLDSPAALQSQRLALQVKQLKDRFKSAVSVTAETAGERLLAWCAMPGVCDAADRARVERIFAKCAKSAARSEDRMKVRLERSFPMPASADATWAVLSDIETVASCMPGAKITGEESTTRTTRAPCR
jgi:hypothetical protein